MPAAGIRGFLDASEFGTWLKHFQSSNKMDKHNIKHFLLAGQVRFDFCSLKFIYSEKDPKFCKISPLLLTTVHTDKSKVETLQKFVAFSEYMN